MSETGFSAPRRTRVSKPRWWRAARLALDRWSVALFSSGYPALVAAEKLKAERRSKEDAITQVVGERVDGKDSGALAVERHDDGPAWDRKGLGENEVGA